MKKIFYLFMLITTAGCNVLSVKTKTKNNYIVFFGSRFTNDTVTCSINKNLIFKNKVLQSDTILGVVPGLSIIQKGDTLSVLNEKNKSIFDLKIEADKTINITLDINKKLHNLTFDRAKGFVVMINNEPYYKKVSFYQSKKIIPLY